MPLAVKTFMVAGGLEAQANLTWLAVRLAIRSNLCKSQATSALYGRLNLVLMPGLCCLDLQASGIHNVYVCSNSVD